MSAPIYRRVFNSATPISIETATLFAPTIAASTPHAALSAKYQPITTRAVASDLMDAGFELHGIRTVKATADTRQGFEKHALTFRHRDYKIGDDSVTATLINSHDGSSSYTLIAGLFRLICENGLMTGDDYAKIRVRHVGANLQDALRAGMFDLLENTRRIHDDIMTMRGTILSAARQDDYATEALALRFDPTTDAAPIAPGSLLTPRRRADTGNNVWAVYNRVQENIIKGGLQARAYHNGRLRTRTLREVKSITENTRVNRDLWTLASTYARNAVPVPARMIEYAA